MRISDWSSDVCSSDLADLTDALGAKGIDDLVALVDKNHVNVTDVGVHRHMVLRQAVIHVPAQGMVSQGLFVQGHADAPDHSTEDLAARGFRVDHSPGSDGADHPSDRAEEQPSET